MMKKLLTLLMAIILVFALCSCGDTTDTTDTTTPDDTTGDTTTQTPDAEEEEEEEDVFTGTLISTVDQFLAIADNMSGNYMLTANIDLADIDWSTPIGGADGIFAGTLDGNGYTLTNLTSTLNAETSAIFAGMYGTVKNLGIQGDNYTCGNWSGIICVDSYGTISNIWYDVNLTCDGTSESFASAACINNYGKVTNNLYVGSHTSTGNNWSMTAGIIIANSESGAYSECYALGDAETQYISGWQADAAGVKTESELKAASLYSTWDTTIWNIKDGSIPTLIADCSYSE